MRGTICAIARASSRPYNDPEFKRNRPIVLARDPWCKGYPPGVHRDDLVGTDAVGHIKPVSQGGGHDLGNLEGTCTPCNSRKSHDEGSRDRRGDGWRSGN